MLSLLAFVSFAAPLMLMGVALLSLPIVAHLLNRRARQRVVFPSITLLSQASASQSQLFKLRRLILLFLRCMVVVLIVAAFAWPLWTGSEKVTATASDSVAVVVLADISASTAQQAEGVAAIESLRAAGTRALDALTRGTDVANLVPASARPQAVFAELTDNLPAVRQEIATLEPIAERADFPAALAIAGELLADHDGPRRLLILTDLQASNWDEVPDALAGSQPLPTGTRVTLVPVDAPSAANMALGPPAIEPANPVAGEPARVSVQLSNYSPREQTLPVELEIDGELADTQSITVEPWQRQDLRFDIALHEPGERRITFSIPDDALNVDNRADLVASVIEQVTVVLVGDDHPDEVGSKSYFLSRALAPRHGEANPVSVRHISAGELDSQQLHGASAVLLSRVGTLTDSAARAMADYIRAGGGVAVFAGDGPVDQNLRLLDELLEGPALPWELSAPRDLDQEGGPLRITQGQWDAPLLDAFDPRSRRTLGEARFHRVWAGSTEHEQASVYLRYDDDTPALAAQRVERGQLMVANFSPAMVHSNLGQYGSFVALMHSLVDELEADRTIADQHRVGQPVTLTSLEGFDRAGPNPQLIGPEGEAVPDAEFTPRDEAGLSAHLPRATAPGFYELVQADRTLALTAVNIDPRESDLRQLEREKLESALSRTGVDLETRGAASAQPLPELRGTELWGWMIAAALAALAMEMALIGLWRR